jgi:hypothetical protein
MVRAFKKPDLKGPRFREKSVKVLTLDLYKRFRLKYPEHDISFEEFKKIIQTYNTNICDGVIEHRDGVELPEALGYIFIGSCPALTKRINVDYKKSIQYGVVTQHKNWASDNKTMKIFFTNQLVRYRIQNKQIWMFLAGRDFKRKASKMYIEDYNKYRVINNNKKVSMLFKMYVNAMRQRMKANIVTSENYNEFDL